jgi:hypothetical protein
MSECSFLARWFLLGGATLALVGLILWFVLPIRQGMPPYLPTALLALGYGTACLITSRRSVVKP